MPNLSLAVQLSNPSLQLSHSGQLLKASCPRCARVLLVQVQSNVLVCKGFDSMLGSMFDCPSIELQVHSPSAPIETDNKPNSKRAKMTFERVFHCDTLSFGHQPRSSLLKTLDSLEIQLKLFDGVNRKDASKRENAAAREFFDSGMFDLGWIKPKPKKFSKAILLWLIGSIVTLVAVASWCCL